ncbi:MAG: hypothetical protein J6O04_05710 [Selenomonadaceae bacterium]|nr:hypothetical protein [Selenomonadaceae bacterium]
MKQFTLPLDKERQRPTLYLESFFRLSAMLDTGAVLPVWVEDEELLQSIGAIQIAENQPFGGFGGMTTGTLYRIPLFRCGDLMFPELPIIASHSELSCQMILSATMFSGLIYEIDDFHHNFNVTIPDKESLVRKLVVEDNNGKLHVLCSGEEKKL